MNELIGRYRRIELTERTSSGITHTEVVVSSATGDRVECFDLSCCDALERALIVELRAYLRPTQAPECLVRRLHAALDQCCHDMGDGGDMGDADHDKG